MDDVPRPPTADSGTVKVGIRHCLDNLLRRHGDAVDDVTGRRNVANQPRPIPSEPPSMLPDLRAALRRDRRASRHVGDGFTRPQPLPDGQAQSRDVGRT